MEAAKNLGRRAVLLGANSARIQDSPEILSLPYVPYSEIFPHTAVIVHQGGSGTTGQSLRAGRPMLIVPYGWDQPDNGARIERLGVGLTLPRTAYSAETATAALQRLLNTPRFAIRASEVGNQMAEEDGLAEACNAIEAVLASKVEPKA